MTNWITIGDEKVEEYNIHHWALVAEKGYKQGSLQKSIGNKETLETELICASFDFFFLFLPPTIKQFLTALFETLSVLRRSQAWQRQPRKQIQ